MLMKWDEFLVSSKERSKNLIERLDRLEMNTLLLIFIRSELISTEFGEPEQTGMWERNWSRQNQNSHNYVSFFFS